VFGYFLNEVPDLDAGRRAARLITRRTGAPCLGVVETLPIYDGLPERGAEAPLLASWDDEVAVLAERVRSLWTKTIERQIRGE
jgi:hypothetical protein